MLYNTCLNLLKLYHLCMVLGWSYALYICVSTITHNGLDSFSLFLATFEIYLLLLTLSLVGLVILLFKGTIQRILSCIHLFTLSLIIYSISLYPETIKNVFLLQIAIPLLLIPLHFNDFIPLIPISIQSNIFLFTFPTMILGEFIYLSTSFLIVDFPFAIYLIINILLLFIVQPICVLLVVSPTLQTHNPAKEDNKTKED